MDLVNNHNVYILGAGFSREAGMPLVSDFLLRMRDSAEWLESQSRDKELKSVESVLAFRREASSAAYWAQLNLENIEELFSLASATPGAPKEDVQVAISATIDYCASVNRSTPYYLWIKDANLTQAFPVLLKEEIDGHFSMPTYSYYAARLLGMLVDGKQKGRNTFISFNYDMLLEEALSQLGVPFSYAFGKQSVNYHPSSKCTTDDDAVRVLKLHGSVNWGKRNNESGRAFTIYGSYGELRGAQATPQIVPPTWSKVFADQLQYVWDASIRALETATRIVVIGFSIPETDLHFKYLLAAGLKKSISLRELIFVNPDIASVEVRARRLLRNDYISDGRIRLLGKKLGEYIESGVGDRPVPGPKRFMKVAMPPADEN